MKQIGKLFSGYTPVKAFADESSALTLVLSIAIPAAIMFSIINAIYDYSELSYILAATAMMLIICQILLRQGKYIRWIREILMLLACIVFSSLLIEGGIANLGLFWSLIFPFFSFLLLGVRLGWIWIGIYLLIQATAYALHGMEIIQLPYSDDVFLIFPMMFIFFTLIAAVFELQNDRYRYSLLTSNHELSRKQKALRQSRDNMEQLIFQRTRELQETNAKLAQEVKQKTVALESKAETEKKFQHAQRMEAIGTLAGGIAHDFNNMLSGITANLFMAQRQMTSEDGINRLNKIGDLSMMAADMIKQLLTFARKDEAELKHFDLRQFINEAYKLAVVSIPESIDCQDQFEKKSMPIEGNTTQIQQILMNLMNNARDALAETQHACIRVSLTVFDADTAFIQRHEEMQQQCYALLEVEDNGPGMDQATCEKIFDPFFTTKQVGKGTGLGLAMVYGAIQSHHGVIEVESSLAHGTCFKLYFPLQQRGTAQPEPLDCVELHRGNGELILLADDNQILRESECAVLQQLGYSVVTARNGLEAKRLYRQQQHEIALVLMDVVMPVMGGAEAARRIRDIDPDAKILFLSGYDKDHDMTSEMIPAGEPLLSKPISIEALSSAICEQLNPG